MIKESYEGEASKSAQGHQDMLLKEDMQTMSLRTYKGLGGGVEVEGYMDVPRGENSTCQSMKASWAMVHFWNYKLARMTTAQEECNKVA